MSNFIGTPGNDTLIGTNGYDNLDGGQGADSMSGLTGNDVYMVDDAADVVIEAANQGIDRVNSTISYTLGPNVEDLWLVGSLATSGTGNALDNVMWGNSADNGLTGLEGNDVLDGGVGADTLIGGTGDDTYWVDNTGDLVIELAGQGADTVKSTLANYTLSPDIENLELLSGAGNINGTGNGQDNVITGNEGDNVLSGGAGNDTLDGGVGKDTLIGGAGDDTYRVDNVGDVVIEQAGEGNDTVISTASSYTLHANVENLTLGTFGGSLEDLNGYGNELGNTLRGNSGNNVLAGGDGDDVLIGGNGSDTLTGGNGKDSFYFSTEDTGTDTITDLASGDVIEICGALFLEGQVITGKGAEVVSGQVQLEVVGNQTILHVGIDATQGADLSIKLDGAFEPSNFHLSGFDIRYDTNHEPSLIHPLPDQSATGGTLFSLQLPSDTFLDIDGDTLTYSAIVVDPDWGYLPLPAWLDFNAETGAFHGTPSSADAGDLTLAVLATDSHEATSSSTFQLSVSPRQEPQNNSPTGTVTISGILTQVQTLSASNTLADMDGLGAISYQWKANGISITSATNATYNLTQLEVGKTITVVASYTDGGGTTETKTSNASAVVANLNDAPTGSVTITGTLAQNQTLTASNTLADLDGLGAISYQWSADGINITDATGNTLVLSSSQAGKTMTVTASYTDAWGTPESVSSAASSAVVPIQYLKGKVQDGYVAGAAIYIDSNGNGIAETSENTGVVTDTQGDFSLSTSLSGPLLAIGGTNVDTGLRNTMTLSAPQGSTIINPVTTLVQTLMDAGGLSTVQAQDQLAQAFGLPTDLDLLSYDPLAQPNASVQALAVQQINAQVALTVSLASDNNQVFDGIAHAVTGVFTAGTGSVNLSNAATVAQIASGTSLTLDQQHIIAQGNSQVQLSTNLSDVALAQKTTVLAALPNGTDWLAPTVTSFSPTDGSVGVAIASDIALTFSEAIALGTGSIILKSAAGATVASYDTLTSSNLSISGNALTINPNADLTYSTDYTVEFAAGSVKDLAGNSYAGTTIYKFTTLQDYTGTSANDSFTSGQGNDTIDGGLGTDTVLYNISRSNCIVAKTSNGFTLTDNTGAAGTDTLTNIERLQFLDKKLALDLDPSQHTGQALEFIGLMAPALGKDPSIVGMILGYFDQGIILHDVCQLAIDVGLVNSIAGSNTNAALAAMAYRNVIGSEADAATVNMLVGYIDGRYASYSQADFMTVIAGMELNQTHIDLVGLQQTGIEYI